MSATIWMAVGTGVVLMVAGETRASCTGDGYEELAGTPDAFAPPTEPTFQTREYATFLTDHWYPGGQGARAFDETGIDLALAHVFRGWDREVCGATLEISIRADGSLSTNDSIRFGYTGSADPAHAFVYWVTLGYAGGEGWYPGTQRVFTFDLANLPPYSGFPTNILPELENGRLEILVEDDSSVDYAILRVCRCNPVGVDAATWGRIKARY